MSGHSKWHSIKHKKAAADAKRGQVFTKIIKEITVAARLGGGDVDSNSRLRLAIEKAKAANMPADNIKKAVQKGTGELPGVTYEEVTYEGYGPAGVAIIVEAMTDNKNRTVSEIRHIFSRSAGNLGTTGCVAWMFEKKGLITINDPKIDEDELLTIALDAGADDLRKEEEQYEITTSVEAFEAVKNAVQKLKIEDMTAEITMIPQNTVTLNMKEGEQMLKLMERLEEHEDVQNVYANFDIPMDIMEQISQNS